MVCNLLSHKKKTATVCISSIPHGNNKQKPDFDEES